MTFLVPNNFRNIYSTQDQGYQILNIINLYVKDSINKLIITDATGGIGGNSIIFCRYFGFVNIIEINNKNVKIIDKNLNYFKNKSIINGDYIELFTNIKQDIVFIDPPWGELYKNNDYINLFINEININHIISVLYNYSEFVILKAPKNFIPIKINKWKFDILKIYSPNGIKHIYNAIVYYK